MGRRGEKRGEGAYRKRADEAENINRLVDKQEEHGTANIDVPDASCTRTREGNSWPLAGASPDGVRQALRQRRE